MLAAGFQQSHFRAAFDQLGQAHGEKFQFELAGFDAGELEQIVGQTIEAGRMIADDFEEAAIIFRIVQGAGEQGFGEAADGGERRLKFVRNVGDEILADALEAAKFGDVVENDDGARRLYIRRCGVGGRGCVIRLQRFDGSRGDGKIALLNESHGDVRLKTLFSEQGAANQAE